MKWLKNKLAFTLVEVVIVIAILAVLSMVVVSVVGTYNVYQDKQTPAPTEQVNKYKNLP